MDNERYQAELRLLTRKFPSNAFRFFNAGITTLSNVSSYSFPTASIAYTIASFPVGSVSSSKSDTRPSKGSLSMLLFCPRFINPTNSNNAKKQTLNMPPLYFPYIRRPGKQPNDNMIRKKKPFMILLIVIRFGKNPSNMPKPIKTRRLHPLRPKSCRRRTNGGANNTNPKSCTIERIRVLPRIIERQIAPAMNAL